MYLIINDERFTVSKRQKTADSVKYYTVSPKPENISGNIQMFRDDGFLMSEDNADGYLRSYATGTLLVLTNIPEPQPQPEPPDTRTAAQKRQDAYEKGYDKDTDWMIEWTDQRYTCDELSQLGMRYAFRDETELADEISELVKAKVGEIRAAYPDENAEVIEA